MKRSQTLKLGVLLDSYWVPAWAFSSLERITNSNYAEFCTIIVNNDEHVGNDKKGFYRLWKNKKEIFYEFFNKVDEKFFIREPNAFQLVDIHELFLKVPQISVKPIRTTLVDIFKPDDVAKIRDYGLDIIIKLGFRRLGGDILSAARYGVWFLDHHDNRAIRGEPAGFWEVVEDYPETGATLSVVGESPSGGQILYRSSYLTYPFSPARNRNVLFWAAATIIPRQIKLLYELGEEHFFAETARFNSQFDFYHHKQYRIPTNFVAVKSYTRMIFRLLHEVYQRHFHLDTWYLLFENTYSSALSFGSFNKMTPPKDRFWADPQVIEKDGRFYIFVEEYLYKNRRGHISIIEMDALGQYKQPIPVLEKNYHISYPFVFEYQNKYYMIPETAQNTTIDLYECVDFPNTWQFKMNLMDNVIAVDTTLFYFENKWWMFTGLAENIGAFPEVELFLFFSDELFSTKWISHPLNPIVSDVTNARPAGKLFTKDGKIYRPAQDCSKMYGHGFNINEVLCLSEMKYLEKKVCEVKPNWDDKVIATHTYTSADSLVMVDGFTRRSRF